MKVKNAVEIILKYDNANTLYQKFQELCNEIVVTARVDLVKPYFQSFSRLNNLTPIEYSGFVGFNQQWLNWPHEKMFHNLNMIHVTDTYKGRVIHYTNGYQLNREFSDLPIGRYLLFKRSLCFVDNKPGDTLFPITTQLMNQGPISQFPVKQSEFYKYYQVGGVNINKAHVYNPNWFVHIGTRVSVLSENEDIESGRYILTSPLG